MNDLYAGIILLGRVSDELRRYGWKRGAWGCSFHPKCAIGAFGAVVYGRVDSLCSIANDHVEGLRLALEVMLKVLSPAQQTALLAKCVELDKDADRDGEWRTYMQDAYAESMAGRGRLQDLEDVIICANDRVIKTEAELFQWFSDAIDLLAEQLPVPASPVIPESEGAPERTLELV